MKHMRFLSQLMKASTNGTQKSSSGGFLSSFFKNKSDLQQCKELGFINQKMSQQIPKNMSSLKTIHNYMQYPHKNKYAFIIIELSKLLRPNHSETLPQEQQVNQQLIDLAVCTENVSLAIYLHASLSNFKNIINDQNYFVGKLLERTLSNKRLVLSGDFFHVKASSLSAKIGYIEIPQYFSKIEENVSKGMIIQETINKKMMNNEHVDKKDVAEMIQLRDTSLISYSLKCLGVIIQLSEQDQEELYEIGVTIGKIVSLKHYQLLSQGGLPSKLMKLDLISLKRLYDEDYVHSVENYEQEVEIQKQILIGQLKNQLQKLKVEDQKINEFVKLI